MPPWLYLCGGFHPQNNGGFLYIRFKGNWFFKVLLENQEEEKNTRLKDKTCLSPLVIQETKTNPGTFGNTFLIPEEQVTR